IEAQKHYVAIHANDKTYRMKASLTDTEMLLDEYFFKCQRSVLVNLRYIKRISREYVILKNDEEIPISRGMAEKIGREIIRLF
ncbi:MAG: LytTR family transcriptional regulator, partial [Acetatifactor sp.]|nr:LytTR family transcriptional regulator [Acetatifactor sp.]